MGFEGLQQRLQRILPGARLEAAALDTPVSLLVYLLNTDYPQGELAPEAVQRVMDNPLYLGESGSGQSLPRARW